VRIPASLRQTGGGLGALPPARSGGEAPGKIFAIFRLKKAILALIKFKFSLVETKNSPPNVASFLFKNAKNHRRLGPASFMFNPVSDTNQESAGSSSQDI
jgi:hypothetical protein